VRATRIGRVFVIPARHYDGPGFPVLVPSVFACFLKSGGHSTGLAAGLIGFNRRAPQLPTGRENLLCGLNRFAAKLPIDPCWLVLKDRANSADADELDVACFHTLDDAPIAQTSQPSALHRRPACSLASFGVIRHLRLLFLLRLAVLSKLTLFALIQLQLARNLREL
jgi:hypothetical protein